jgi:hypothetical protein
VFELLGEEPRAVEELREGSRLGEEEFDKALEKLEIHGGARMDFGGNVTAGGTGMEEDLHGAGAVSRGAVCQGAALYGTE